MVWSLFVQKMSWQLINLSDTENNPSEFAQKHANKESYIHIQVWENTLAQGLFTSTHSIIALFYCLFILHHILCFFPATSLYLQLFLPIKPLCFMISLLPLPSIFYFPLWFFILCLCSLSLSCFSFTHTHVSAFSSFPRCMSFLCIVVPLS